MKKTVYILIGKKGSGKSYIGELIEKELGIRFFQVEPYFINNKKDYENINNDSFKESWNNIKSDILKILIKENSIILESLGTYQSFKDFLKDISKYHSIKLIKINTNNDLCIKRIKSRDNKNHVQMNENTINEINKLVEDEQYKFDLVINNETLSDIGIINELRSIIN